MLYGVQRSGVRYQLRMGQSCISDGEQLLAGVVGVFYRYVTGRFSEDDYYNLNDVFLSFNTKCNLVDTIQGTFILNFVINRLDSIKSF
jgi:hypothetical protein